MKKLIALIGAAATAFGLYAAAPDFIANSFETATEGLAQDGETWAAALPWSTTLDEAFTVGNYATDELKNAEVYTDTAKRRDGSDGNVTKFENLTVNNKFLKLETGTNVLDCAVTGLTGTTSASQKFYFDQLVKFTGFEEIPTFAEDTKIAVWMSAIEEEGEQGADDYIAGSTNLYVQVGKADGTTTNVALVGEWAVDTWYRITIKSIGNIIPGDGYGLESQLGFLIFVNGVPATIVAADRAYYGDDAGIGATAKSFYGNGQLFTAMTTDVTLAKVGYQGIGGIDDVVLSEEAPDFDSTIDVEFLPVDGITIAKVVDSKGNQFTDFTGAITVAAGSITVTLKPAPGYFFYNKDGDRTTSLTWTGEAAAQVTVELGEGEEITEAVAMIVHAADPTNPEYLEETDLMDLTGLADGDVATILKPCSITDAYSFTPNTTITVAEGGIWNVNIANWVFDNKGTPENKVGELVDDVGLYAGKTVNVTFGEPIGNTKGTLCISGEILGDIIAAGNGIVEIAYNDVVTLAGTITAANIVVCDTVTFVGGAKIVSSATDLNDFINKFAADDGVVEVVGAGPWTAQIKAEEEDTGFAIIIADNKYKYFPTLQDAINAAGVDEYADYTTVVITKDATLTERVTINNKTVTLTADEAVTVSCATAGVLNILNNSDVTIGENVTLSSPVNSTVRILGVEVKTDAGDGKKSKLTINGTITNTNPTFDQAFTIAGNGGDADGVDIIVGKTGVVSNPNGAAIYFAMPGTLTVDGKVEGYSAIIAKDGTITINEGAIVSAIGTNYTALPLNRDGSTPTGDAIVGGYYPDSMGYGVPKIVVNGGTITAVAEGAAGVNAYDHDSAVAPATSEGNVAVQGGTFNKPVAEGYCANGYIPLANDDGTYGVKEGTYVARVNGQQGYETLADAFDAVEDGGTVTLLANVTLDAALTINTETTTGITLDLGGKTLTGALTISGTKLEIANGTISSDQSVYLKDGADVKLAADATIASTAQIACWITETTLATLTVEGVIENTYDGGVGIECDGGTPEINIEDGAIVRVPNGDSYAIGIYAEGALNVNGGELVACYAIEYQYAEVNLVGGVLNGYLMAYYDISLDGKLTDSTKTIFRYKGPAYSGATVLGDLCAEGYEPQLVGGVGEYAAYYQIAKATYNVTVDDVQFDTYQISDATHTVELTEPAAKEHKKFTGWTTEATGVTFNDNVATIAAGTTGNIAITSEWADLYAITFEVTGGTADHETSPVELEKDAKIVFTATGDNKLKSVTIDGVAEETIDTTAITYTFTVGEKAATVAVVFAAEQSGWDDKEAGDGESAASKYGISPDSKLANVDAGKLGAWATEKKVDFAAFMAAPDTFEEAYLLDCAVEEVETKKAEFKFTAIVPGVTPTIGDAGKYGNGKVEVYGATKLGADADWAIGKEGATFYKAKLVPVAYNENK